ncbi:hypothetical protein CTEN210_02814 [Chaetoceros tenuissimus]|uniref:RING-type E3 ubiquitin transferase n=1 Tax=Chaetoceros tenuissimus TaxID=426638 RepID=A0AAD3H0Y6_9STRA|nr:hypothetical protein CTEN210_02814 [Chaetoceros tenuissimus]
MQSSTSSIRGAMNEGSIMNTSSSNRNEETSSTSQENDEQEILGSNENEIAREKDELYDENEEEEWDIFKYFEDDSIGSRSEDELMELYNLHSTIQSACCEKRWQQVEDFLSDKSISNQDKRIVLQKHNSKCCRNALVHRAPSTAPFVVIKGMIDVMDPESPQYLTFGDSDSSWLHSALRFTKESMRYNAEEVSFDVIELLVSSGGKKLVNMRSNCKSERKRTPLQIYLERGYCPKIINLLLEVGGLELLEIEDEDGYSARDFSNESQRKIIVDYLKTLKECPRVQKHIEAFEARDVTPKDFYDWNSNKEFDLVRSYLDSDEVSIEAKMKCINVQTALDGRPFHSFCENHGPLDIAEKFVDIVGKDVLFFKDEDGNNCLHKACGFSYFFDHEDEEPTDSDIEAHCELVAFLLSQGGLELLLETNEKDDSALWNLMMCRLTKVECVRSVLKIVGDDLLAFRDKEIDGYKYGGHTILHYASFKILPDKEIIKYLVSVGCPRLTEVKNSNGVKAEDKWSDELKEYIAFTTKTLPTLSDELQCPICFDTLFDGRIISKCCHRFCKSCITQSYKKRGNTCPVCRTEFSMRDVKKDPLLGKLAMAIKEEKGTREELQAQLLESQKENQSLREQLQNALKRKQDDL